jgi:hypothetical protein
MRRVRRFPDRRRSGALGDAGDAPPERTLLNGMNVVFTQRVALTPVVVDFVEPTGDPQADGQGTVPGRN